MKIADFIVPELVFPSLQATDKMGVLRELAAKLAEASRAASAETLFRVLHDREVQASTAVGEGVAIPHGKHDAIGRLLACVARSPAGVEFGSIDGKPTHLFVVLVWPESSTGLHLKALARISRVFKDASFRGRMLAAAGAAEMHAALVERDSLC